jgi:hypothetical protein
VGGIKDYLRAAGPNLVIIEYIIRSSDTLFFQYFKHIVGREFVNSKLIGYYGIVNRAL